MIDWLDTADREIRWVLDRTLRGECIPPSMPTNVGRFPTWDESYALKKASRSAKFKVSVPNSTKIVLVPRVFDSNQPKERTDT